jgi:hypothetical protein
MHDETIIQSKVHMDERERERERREKIKRRISKTSQNTEVV